MRHQFLCLQVGGTKLITVAIRAGCSMHKDATSHYYSANGPCGWAHSIKKAN